MMDNKKQFKVPGFLLAIIAILVVCIIFIFVVQVPFSQNYDKYQEDHASAVSQISVYNDYLARADEVQSKIDELRTEYEQKSVNLYANATTSPDDIRAMLRSFNYDILALSINTGVPDDQGRTTVAGGLLYSTSVNYKFVCTEENISQTLNYLELEADSAYYIDSINVTNYVDPAANAQPAEDEESGEGSGDQSGEQSGEASAETSKKQASDDAEIIQISGASGVNKTGDVRYEVTINMSLYYFVAPPEEESVEESVEESSQA